MLKEPLGVFGKGLNSQLTDTESDALPTVPPHLSLKTKFSEKNKTYICLYIFIDIIIYMIINNSPELIISRAYKLQIWLTCTLYCKQYIKFTNIVQTYFKEYFTIVK